MAAKMPRIVKHPAALRDILEIADYLSRTASLTVALRFVDAAERTIEQIARKPGTGGRWESDKPELLEIRYIPVTKFRNHLVFYRPVEDGIEVLRVLHGARDLTGILEDEESSGGW